MVGDERSVSFSGGESLFGVLCPLYVGLVIRVAIVNDANLDVPVVKLGKKLSQLI
jgi:hypothetical protein